MALIPFDDRDGTIWLNGEMLPWRDAKTHTLSHGLHYASLVFEGERVYSGTIFKGREHTERLRNSCKIMDFDIPLSDDEVDAAKMAVVEANGITDGYVRAFCWRGSEMMAVSAQNTKTHVAIAAWEWPSYFDPETKMQGITLDIAETAYGSSAGVGTMSIIALLALWFGISVPLVFLGSYFGNAIRVDWCRAHDFCERRGLIAISRH